MSLRAITWAFDQHDTTPVQRLLLLAYADFANSDDEAWPKIDTIIEKTGYSKATIYRERTKLCDAGKLEKLEQRDHYRLILTVRKKVSEGEKDSQGENGSTYRNRKEPPTTLLDEASEQRSDPAQELYDSYLKIVMGEESKPVTPSLRRQADKALAEYDLPSLVTACRGFVNWRRKKPGDKRFSSVFASHPGGRPLHDHIAFWIENAEGGGASALDGVPSEERVKITRAIVDAQRAFGSKDPDTLATGEQALAFLKERGIEPETRGDRLYFPSMRGQS